MEKWNFFGKRLEDLKGKIIFGLISSWKISKNLLEKNNESYNPATN